MRYRLFVVLLTSIFLILPNFLFSQNQQVGSIHIGLILDGPWGEQNQMLESMKKEILDLTAGEFDVQFPSEKTIVADWNLAGIQNGINQLLADDEVDIIITLGIVLLLLLENKLIFVHNTKINNRLPLYHLLGQSQEDLRKWPRTAIPTRWWREAWKRYRRQRGLFRGLR